MAEPTPQLKAKWLNLLKPLDGDLAGEAHPGHELFLMAVLLALGVYCSILYFGHHIMPSPDFVGFLQVGRELWSFHLPTDWMRAPVYGLVVYPLSFVVGGPHPALTAAWLINALLQPCNAVLLFLVCRRIVGNSAVWLTLLFVLNPWQLEVSTKAIAEVTLLFFMLLSLLCTFKGSRYAYLFAAIATMVRYDGAALILAAFVLDMIRAESNRARWRTVGLAALASVPLALWLLGTMLCRQNMGEGHYLRQLDAARLITGANLQQHLGTLWTTAVGPFCNLMPGGSVEGNRALRNIAKALTWVAFAGGVWHVRKSLYLLAILIVFVAYLVVHIAYSFCEPRLYVPVAWIVLLTAWCGLRNGWLRIAKRVPGPVTLGAQIVLVAPALVVGAHLVKFLPRLASISPRSTMLPCVALACGVVIAAVGAITRRQRVRSSLVVIAIVGLLLLSNQFYVASVLRDGQADAEFKQLLDWYTENAQDGERLASTLSAIMALLAPAHEQDLLTTAEFTGGGFAAFADRCRAKGVAYVAWDSRLGTNVSSVYYGRMHLEDIAALKSPRDVGPFQYIRTFICEGRYINLFRLLRSSPQESESPPAPPGPGRVR